MFGNIEISLTKENGKPFFYNRIKIHKEIEELKKLLIENPDLRNLDELKVMKSIRLFIGEKRRNSYIQTEGYIFNHKDVSTVSIIDLHERIIPEEKNYRVEDVYILNNDPRNWLGDFDKGIPKELIGTKMEELMNYINSSNVNNEIDIFIKSQIIHFYFVYIHPFLDGNGRCARSLSKLYLLNQDSYYLTLITRGLMTSKEEYKRSIIKSKNGDISPFLKYSLKALINELKIENSIQEIEKEKIIKLNEEEYNALQYLFHLKEKTLDSFANYVLLYEKYQSKEDLIKRLLSPLIEKGIIKLEEGKIEIINDSLDIKKIR